MNNIRIHICLCGTHINLVLEHTTEAKIPGIHQKRTGHHETIEPQKFGPINR